MKCKFILKVHQKRLTIFFTAVVANLTLSLKTTTRISQSVTMRKLTLLKLLPPVFKARMALINFILLKWSLSPKGTKNAMLRWNGKRMTMTQPHLLWQLHGKIVSKKRLVPVVISKGTRSLRFNSLKQCACWLAKYHGKNQASCQAGLPRIQKHVGGWQTHCCYCGENMGFAFYTSKGELPLDEDLRNCSKIDSGTSKYLYHLLPTNSTKRFPRIIADV